MINFEASIIFKAIILLLFSINVFGQQEDIKITGVITNHNQEKVSFAEVYLSTPQNELIKTTIAQDGIFEFTQLKPGQYFLQINSENGVYKEPIFDLLANKVFAIIIEEKILNIEEVQIYNKRKAFVVQNGNINIDIANTALNKVATTADLFAKLPFILLNPNGEGVSMVGKGTPLLYIDNQKVDFSTLSALSVDDIKAIEIIRNPSAKYEAEGKAVVKVILKNSRKEGYTMTFNETAVFNKRFGNYFSANFQQKKNKTEWKLNGAYNQIQHWESNGFVYAIPSKSIDSDYVITSITNRPQVVLGANLYQELNGGDYLTFAISTNLRPDKGDNNTTTNYERNGVKSRILSLDQQERQRATVNSIFNYNKQFNSIGTTIFTGLQFTRQSNNVDHDFYDDIDNSSYVFSQYRRQKYAVNAFSGRIDVEKRIKDNYQLGLGASFTKADAMTNNLTDYPNINSSNYFKYSLNEDNWASYADLASDNERFSFEGGLRVEGTSAKGVDQILNEVNVNRKYLDWFPSASVSFKHSEDYVYSLNFNRNISRPNYGDLAAGGLYSSPYVEYDGNPNLVPTYTNTISASVNIHQWALNASVYESENPMGFGLFYDDGKNISRFSTKNFEAEKGISLGIDVPLEYKSINSQNSLSFNYSKTMDSLAIIHKSTPYIYLYSNNTIGLGQGFQFLLDGYWLTKRTQGIYEYNEMLIVNLGLTKAIYSFDFTMRYNDVFKQNTFIQNLSYDKIITKGSFYGNTPVFSLGVKYNFGKISKSEYKEKQINQTLERI